MRAFLRSVIAVGTISVAAAQNVGIGLDRNNNQLNDIWELIYGTRPAGADSDGDGFTNVQESLAGSNPADANSTPPRLLLERGPGFDATFSWSGAPGKRYQLEE